MMRWRCCTSTTATNTTAHFDNDAVGSSPTTSACTGIHCGVIFFLVAMASEMAATAASVVAVSSGTERLTASQTAAIAVLTSHAAQLRSEGCWVDDQLDLLPRRDIQWGLLARNKATAWQAQSPHTYVADRLAAQSGPQQRIRQLQRTIDEANCVCRDSHPCHNNGTCVALEPAAQRYFRFSATTASLRFQCRCTP
eukprot:COSAG01_NODE_9878_length_2314_cov_1.575621_2_plen_196_part_00